VLLCGETVYTVPNIALSNKFPAIGESYQYIVWDEEGETDRSVFEPEQIAGGEATGTGKAVTVTFTGVLALPLSETQ